MKDNKRESFESTRKYDNPIPKPPDEFFDDFLRNTEARLVTRRFNVNPRRAIKPVTGNAG